MSAFIEQQKAAGFAVALICRTLGVSASAYYQRSSGQRSVRAVEDEQLLAQIGRLHCENYEAYGYRKMHVLLRRQGIEVGRDRVRRLMRQAGIQGAKRRGRRWRTTIADPAAQRRPDLLERHFVARAPDEVYVADLTYLRCWEGPVFFAFVLDVHTRRVVGWQLATHMRAELVCDALRMAVATRPRSRANVALVHHSDRGTQYTSVEFAGLLAEHGVRQSVGSVGDALDNAMAESFVDTLKTELIRDRVWRTRTQLELALVEWIGWFNTARLHQSLGDRTPAEIDARHELSLVGGASRGPATPAVHTQIL